MKRQVTLFPRHRRVLEQFGENIKLAVKRRSITQSQLSQRTGFDPKTIRKMYAGDPGVAIGYYLMVLSVLGMADNFAEVAAHDELGQKLQNMKLLGGRSE